MELKELLEHFNNGDTVGEDHKGNKVNMTSYIWSPELPYSKPAAPDKYVYESDVLVRGRSSPAFPLRSCSTKLTIWKA